MRRVRVLLEKPLFKNVLIHSYAVISLLNIVVWANIDTNLYMFFGNHSIMLYPYWGLLIAAELELKYMVVGLFLYWLISVLLFVSSYVVGLAKKQYQLLRIAILADAVFSLVFCLKNWQYDGFVDMHIAIVLGAGIDFLFAWYLSWYEHQRAD